jgi:hypothetical protein
MRRVVELGIMGLAAGAIVAPIQLKAEEVSSVYTALDLDKCKLIEKPDLEEGSGRWRCAGFEGIDVEVAEGDLRMSVAFGPKAEDQIAAGQTLPKFNTIGKTLEWRVEREGTRWNPFATILRPNWEANGEKGVTLVVTKLDKDDACHMAYVDAARYPQANDQARAIADKDARSFDCKHDEAKHYGPDGQEIKAP